MRDLDAVPGEDFSTKSNHKMMLIAVTSGSARRRWRRGSVSDSQAPMLDSGHMKNTLCSSTSMDKDMCLYKRPNIVDEKLGSTDTGMKLISGTDCDNKLATEATCSRCRCRVLLPFKRQLCGTERGGQKKDSTSSSHQVLAVTEMTTALLMPAQTSAQLTGEGHGVVATFA